MTLEEKRKLLTDDIMSRANYWIDLKVDYNGQMYTMFGFGAGRVSLLANPFMSNTAGVAPLIEEIKPYLRPLSSMTEQEEAEFSNLFRKWFDDELFILTEEPMIDYALSQINYSISTEIFDWLNARHFDYRGLIDKGLAIMIPEEMYNR